MMRRFSIILISALSFGCDPAPRNDLAMIQDVMNGQAIAWNKGDIEGYMRGYWMSDSLVFTGGKSVSHGWQAALDRYLESYPNKSAMGNLTFDNVETEFSSKNTAYSIGQWTLNREQDTLSGRFTLVWKRVNNVWVIVADHSS